MSGLKVNVPVWPELKPLLPDLLPVECFDRRLLPSAFRDFVSDASFRMDDGPLDYIGIAVMVVAGSLISGKVQIQPKKNDSWCVVPNLWGLVIGRPSAKKTPALKEACAAIETLDRESAEVYRKEKEEHEHKLAFHKVEMLKAKKSSVELLDKDREKAKLKFLEACDHEPLHPIRHRRVVNDTTTEKLGEILHDNPSGVLIFRDELTGWLRSLDKVGREQDRALYLEAWTGGSRFTYDRIGRGTIAIDNLIVSILGGIQPGKLKSYLLSRQDGEGDDGLLERFQMLTYPDHKSSKRIDQKPNQIAIDKSIDAFRKLDSLPVGELKLKFSGEAQEIYNDWYDENLAKTSKCIDVHLESLLGKYPSLVASLSLIIHLCEADVHTPISLDATTRACGWAEYLESHAKRVNALVNHPALHAERLATHLKDLNNPFTPREVQQKGWKGLNTSEDIKVALDLLCDSNYIKFIRVDDTGGRPSNRYEINPKLL